MEEAEELRRWCIDRAIGITKAEPVTAKEVVKSATVIEAWILQAAKKGE